MNPITYQYLANHSDTTWICCQCGMPSFSSSLFNITPVDLSNSFTSLNSNSASPTPVNSPNPVHTSTPDGPNRTTKRTHKTAFNRPLRILTINFQSCKNKVQELEHLASSVKPDVIIGTETWLNSSIHTSEIFKPELGYNVYRKDRRHQSYGGVLIAISNNLISSEYTDLDTDCEILWAQVNLVGAKSLYIGAFYRPPNSDLSTIDNLNQSLSRLTHRTNGNIWLGGDFNALHIDWPSLVISLEAGGKRAIYQRLIDISLEHNIEQVIDKPTRGDNILDLLFTNNKSTLHKFDTLPPLGKSDHDIIYSEITVRPNRVNPPYRTVYIFRKANWEGIKQKLTTLFNNMQNSTDHPPVNELWESFKTTLLNAMQEFIPQKQIKPRHVLPWVTHSILKLVRAKQRLHSKLRQHHCPNNLDKYKKARHTLQREIRKSYWTYLENIIDYTTDEQDKHTKQHKFWSFIKQIRKDSFAIPPLRSQREMCSEAQAKAEILKVVL